MTKYATIAAYTLAWILGSVALLFVACTLGGSFIELRLWTPLENEGVRASIVGFAVLLSPLGLCLGAYKVEGK